ncbi:MAG: SpoIIE family protein phosphatase [Bacteroidia bacterium]|nr:SpoIIE family protein phosphatase [Bacteroidia bacterium]
MYLCNLLFFSIRYARSFSKVEELTESLEQRVWERTAEIFHQNRALELQKNEIIKQNKIIAKKNEDVTASINYASRIQRAILGSQEAIVSNFKESFIFLAPRDIVSGDFYWYTEVKRSGSNKAGIERQTIFFKVIVAADCTGHGIPGAFMTVMGSALLDEIINENKVTNPSRILSILDRKLLMKLQRHNVHDGMDLAILFFDDENRRISFAGANNPLYYVRDGELHQIPGSKFPVGSSQYNVRKKFDTYNLDYQEGDVFYIFSDGFQDQFGGVRGRKYYKKRFREFLLSISHLPMKEQRSRIQQEFETWKGNLSQTDDILVIGVRT